MEEPQTQHEEGWLERGEQSHFSFQITATVRLKPEAWELEDTEASRRDTSVFGLIPVFTLTAQTSSYNLAKGQGMSPCGSPLLA